MAPLLKPNWRWGFVATALAPVLGGGILLYVEIFVKHVGENSILDEESVELNISLEQGHEEPMPEVIFMQFKKICCFISTTISTVNQVLLLTPFHLFLLILFWQHAFVFLFLIQYKTLP